MIDPPAFLELYGGWAVVAAVGGLSAGGFAKGVVGFALPLIAIGVTASFMPYEVALALLIVPTLVSNLFQALRGGIGAAWGSLRRFWWLNLVLVVVIALSAQLVVALPDRLLLSILGAAVSVFGLSQLVGWRPTFPPHHQGAVELGVGTVAGFFGGLSGVWGPPLIMYLLALRLPKTEMVRAQGLSFLLGSVVFLGAHLRSGVLNAVTLPASVLLVLPTMLAMFAGYVVHDRLDQQVFRRATLAVLVVTGLNLLRRGLFA